MLWGGAGRAQRGGSGGGTCTLRAVQWAQCPRGCLPPPCRPRHPPAMSCHIIRAGEEPHSGIIAGITPGNPTLVTTVEDERLEFQDGACRGLAAGAGGGCAKGAAVLVQGAR